MFIKGKSGNPAGRPADPFAAMIRKKLKNKASATKFFESAWNTAVDSTKVDADTQLRYRTWMMDRAYGKAVADSQIKMSLDTENRGIQISFVGRKDGTCE